MIGVLWEPNLVQVYRVVKTGEKDRYGKEITSRSLIPTPSGEQAYDGQLRQAKSAEGEAFVVGEYQLRVESGADIRSGDEIEIGTDKYTVEGKPLQSRIPGHPAVSHTSVALRHVGPVAT